MKLPGANSLFWRLFTAIVITALIGQAFALLLVWYDRQQANAKQFSENVVSTLGELEDNLDELSPRQRSRFLDAYNRPFSPQLISRATPPPKDAYPVKSALAVRISGKLNNLTDPTTRILERDAPRRQLWIPVNLLGDAYWLVMPFGRYQTTPEWPWLPTIGIFLLLSSVGAGFAVWRLNRPLVDLTAAARKLGDGALPEALPIQGPQEVQALSRQFNQMCASLHAAELERNTMLGGISHDLRTPLARLRLAIEMSSDLQSQPGMIEDIEDINHIIGQFTDYLRGNEEPFGAVNLSELIEDMARRYARQDTPIQCHTAPVVDCTLQALSVQRVIGNLLDNALKYGAPPYEITCYQQGNQLEVVITDQGPGIPESSYEAALSPFERLDKARTADGGSGLGLAIVRRAVLRQGGQVTLAQNQPSGLKVTLSFPVPPA